MAGDEAARIAAAKRKLDKLRAAAEAMPEGSPEAAQMREGLVAIEEKIALAEQRLADSGAADGSGTASAGAPAEDAELAAEIAKLASTGSLACNWLTTSVYAWTEDAKDQVDFAMNSMGRNESTGITASDLLGVVELFFPASRIAAVYGAKTAKTLIEFGRKSFGSVNTGQSSGVPLVNELREHMTASLDALKAQTDQLYTVFFEDWNSSGKLNSRQGIEDFTNHCKRFADTFEKPVQWRKWFLTHVVRDVEDSRDYDDMGPVVGYSGYAYVELYFDSNVDMQSGTIDPRYELVRTRAFIDDASVGLADGIRGAWKNERIVDLPVKIQAGINVSYTNRNGGQSSYTFKAVRTSESPGNTSFAYSNASRVPGDPDGEVLNAAQAALEAIGVKELGNDSFP